MKRREFITFSTLLLSANLFADTRRYALHVKITQEPYQSIAKVIEDLFIPSAGMPSPHTFNVIGFLQAVMQDKRVKNTTKEFLLNGVGWLNEAAQKNYSKNYIELSIIQREAVLKQVSQTSWGDGWLWYLLNYSFEAMFSDPVYGANEHKIGWQWLDYEPGIPRPKEVNPYV